MDNRYVVLGSNSFSGSHFVAHLLERGHEVLGLSRSPEVSQVFRAYAWKPSKGRFAFQQVDLNDKERLGDAILDFNPDYVVNFAAQSMVAQSWDSPEDWYQTNVMGVVELAKVLENLEGLKKYVHVTTPEVYGSTNGWVPESRDFNPSTPYAISRASGDMHLMVMQATRGLPVVFTRAANVYGAGQQLYRIVPRALLNARLGRKLVLDGGGRSTRSFIHISDVVSATYIVAHEATPGDSFHISTREIVSVREVVALACSLAGRDSETIVVDGPERPGKDDTYMLDSSRLRQELGWASKFTLEQGMRQTLDWIDANLSDLAKAQDSYVHKK